MSRFWHSLAASLLLLQPGLAAEPPAKELTEAATHLNHLGTRLFLAAGGARPGNFVVCPWPTHRSLSLAFLGARGETKAEISTALGAPDPAADGALIQQSIAKSAAYWNSLMSTALPGSKTTPLEWNDLSAVWVTHRGDGRIEYLNAAKKVAGTHVSAIDFDNPGKAQVDVNNWIATATQQRISRLLPPGAFTAQTRLAITSAVYLKAPWRSHFKAVDTLHEGFQVNGASGVRVPTMIGQMSVASAMRDGYTVLGLSIAAGQFQLLIFLPDKADELAALEKQITPKLLQECNSMESSMIELHLPKFGITASMALSQPLRAMGIQKAFEHGKADFGAMANAPLYLSDVFAGCEFRIDELGVSGAGAVAMVSAVLGHPEPVPAQSVVRVDRPFAFALQHIPSSACLFIGRITDPR